MKQTINLGAYGWQRAHWIESFYPDDLPEDWQLGYYSNEFNTVLVPADYWQSKHAEECENWLDDVHQSFQFFIECHSRMLDMISPAELTEALLILKPQLSGLVFLGDEPMSSVEKDQFDRLVEDSEAVVFCAEHAFETNAPETNKIWRPGCITDNHARSRFAFIEDDLSDLRSSRELIEPFTTKLNDDEAGDKEATMIVSHPDLQAADLTKFRSVLEIMGH